MLDVTNRRFGKLTVIKRVRNPDKFGQVKWKCRCDCGRIVYPTGRCLTLGKTKSCGCLMSEAPKEHSGGKKSSNWTGYGDIPGSYWKQLLRHAKVRSREVTISLNDAWEQYLKQNGICALSGEPINFGIPGRKNRASITASLDRIDSSKGYIVDNIQWVHKHVNIMKWNLTEQRFVELCNKISNYARTR